MAAPFIAPIRPQDQHPWLYVGPSSVIPDLDGSSKVKLNESSTPGASTETPLCQIVQLNKSKPRAQAASESQDLVDLENQVLVLQYRGKYHAFDHQCPHQSYPLSRGSLHDIEDFGIILSAGIRCPRHGWAFDLFTGESDRGAYQLKIWDVELRFRDEDGMATDDEQVWIKRRVKRREG